MPWFDLKLIMSHGYIEYIQIQNYVCYWAFSKFQASRASPTSGPMRTLVAKSFVTAVQVPSVVLPTLSKVRIVSQFYLCTVCFRAANELWDPRPCTELGTRFLHHTDRRHTSTSIDHMYCCTPNRRHYPRILSSVGFINMIHT